MDFKLVKLTKRQITHSNTTNLVIVGYSYLPVKQQIAIEKYLHKKLKKAPTYLEQMKKEGKTTNKVGY